jgi:predicted Zn-dependent protease
MRVMRHSNRPSGLLVGVLCGLLLLPACTTLSVDEEEQIGNEASRELRKELDFVRDEWVVKYVRDIGAQVVKAAGPSEYDYEFFVVQDDELNAFALPAGYIYIHTEIILEAANVSELAGVIGHEVGHVALRHVARNYNRQRNTGILYNAAALAASIFVGGHAAAGGQMLGQLAAVAYVNQFTREAEVEADRFAVEFLPQAGYDPAGMVSFFETLRAKSGGDNVPTFMRSHPATSDRIAHTQGLIEEAELGSGLKITDNGQLELIQRRIELLTRR